MRLARDPESAASLGGDWIFCVRTRPGAGRAASAREARSRRSPHPAPVGPDPSRVAPERRLAAEVRAQAPLRRVLCALAGRLVATRGWERLAFARLSDYATERFGLAARTLHEWARVDRALAGLPRIEAAFLAGELAWTKLRLLARVAGPAEEAHWLARAKALSVPSLSREVGEALRAARASEAGGASGIEHEASGEEAEAFERVEVRCRPRVRAQWAWARERARRVAGQALPTWECAEVIAAEVLSAAPPAEEGADDLDEAAQPGAALAECLASPPGLPPPPEDASPDLPSAGLPAPLAASEAPLSPPETSAGTGAEPATAQRSRALPVELRPLVEGLDAADAFELDARLVRAVALEQSQEARIGPLLRAVVEGHLYRARGWWQLDAYLRERLGLCPRKARALLRLERAGERCPGLLRAYRSGQLSWVRAHALASLLLLLPRERQTAWIAWAGRVSVRRLEDDVREALVLRDLEPARFAATGGWPPEPLGDPRQIGARDDERGGDRGADGDPLGDAWQIGARDGGGGSAPGQASAADEAAPAEVPGGRQIGAHAGERGETARIGFRAPLEAARFFRAVLASVRERLEAQCGAPASEGDALEAMLQHVLAAWGRRDGRLRAEHRVFERDDWRCLAPGCSSYRNLQAHHVVFRSLGGSGEASNLATQCAFHHQRGIHAGRMHCSGRAPDALRFELGLRRGRPPLLCYGPGETRS